MKFAAQACLASLLLLLTGCSDDASYESADMASVEEMATASDIAFSYDYTYEMKDDRISEVQERQAAACEALGPLSCRITGIDYQILPDERVQGSLSLALARDHARGFGKQATAMVEDANGRLVRARFDGEDMRALLENSDKDMAALQAELDRLRSQLGAGNLDEGEASQLRKRIRELERQLLGSQQRVNEAGQRLAVSPMSFHYYGALGAPGFGKEDPFTEAWHSLQHSGALAIRFILVGLAVIVPWLIVIALVLALLRTPWGLRIRDSLRGRTSSE